ncbi:Sensor protein FixL [Rubripirellula lacrimiformis]|uniref:histidine kinase n=1 Tax=Rubripirellula lacrimiformis TaxID=1930273 RepID=A0A517N972_9BACT|nr:PAS domain S-box protein [Rubripirellula lacrimiformis]QDT03672.1 Sensor protein FixL [Rubripirellula lacrimiformis]
MSKIQAMLESDLRCQTRVLKRLAEGASLDEVLQTLVEVSEESRPDMIASVLLINQQTGCLENGASRQLPEFYCKAVDGLRPGPSVGSCGTAAFTGKRVIVKDISTDPLWKDVRQLAQRANLHACWSEPIISASGEVLGTFAMYYRSPRAPNEHELAFVSNGASLAALAIQRVRYQFQVEHERAMFKTIIRSVPDALISTTLDRRITHFNRGATELFGYTIEEMLGKKTERLYANREDYILNLKVRFSGKHSDNLEASEILWRRKSGETFFGELVGTVVRDDDGQAIGFLGLIRDITDRKAAEAELAASQVKLVQAERLAAMGQMISAIAHESRNALQRIQVGVDMLQYEIKPENESRDDLDRISRAKADLQQLHDELRSFAGPIQLNITTCNIAEIWRQAWSNLQVSRKDRNAQLVEEIADVDLTCPIDAFRIEQVFRNLFENSLAAGKDPLQITVSCETVQSQNLYDVSSPHLRISVRDNGPGLPEEIRGKVFEAFHTTKVKGTGLGMAIARRFVEAHQGTIKIRDESIIGAEFIIELPRKPT